MSVNPEIITDAIREAEKENERINKAIARSQAFITENKKAVADLEKQILVHKAEIESNLHDIQTANAQRYENFGTINALKKILE